jgi:hypothetical protein
MPIRKYLHDGAFDPETTHAMGEAFTTVLKRLDELGRTHISQESVAAYIISVAENGEREAHRITVTALSHFIGKESSGDGQKETDERKEA